MGTDGKLRSNTENWLLTFFVKPLPKVINTKVWGLQFSLVYHNGVSVEVTPLIILYLFKKRKRKKGVINMAMLLFMKNIVLAVSQLPGQVKRKKWKIKYKKKNWDMKLDLWFCGFVAYSDWQAGDSEQILSELPHFIGEKALHWVIFLFSSKCNGWILERLRNYNG